MIIPNFPLGRSPKINSEGQRPSKKEKAIKPCKGVRGPRGGEIRAFYFAPSGLDFLMMLTQGVALGYIMSPFQGCLHAGAKVYVPFENHAKPHRFARYLARTPYTQARSLCSTTLPRRSTRNLISSSVRLCSSVSLCETNL